MEIFERIYNELKHERSAIWYISDEYGSKIMIKVPSNVARSLINGCPIFFLFGKDTNHPYPIIHTGIRIFDDPIHFTNISGTNRHKDEHLSLKKIMELRNVVMQIYNELNSCVATVNVSFSEIEAARIINMIGEVDSLYVGEFDKRVAQSLNSFDFTFDPSRKLPGVYELNKELIGCSLSEFSIVETHFVGANESSKVIIADKNEGDVFEKQVWTPLQSLFDFDIYRNPQINEKNGLRELTDILAFSKYGIFLIETKSLAIFNLEKERTMERKVASVQKQIVKAIDQLTGAVKKIAERVEIYDSKKNLIHFDKSHKPTAIVLVSELFQFGDWKPIEFKMFSAMLEQPMFLVVMDLKEFIRYIGFSRGSRDKFDYLLMERAKKFIELQSIHMEIHEGEN